MAALSSSSLSSEAGICAGGSRAAADEQDDEVAPFCCVLAVPAGLRCALVNRLAGVAAVCGTGNGTGAGTSAADDDVEAADVGGVTPHAADGPWQEWLPQQPAALACTSREGPPSWLAITAAADGMVSGSGEYHAMASLLRDHSSLSVHGKPPTDRSEACTGATQKKKKIREAKEQSVLRGRPARMHVCLPVCLHYTFLFSLLPLQLLAARTHQSAHAGRCGAVSDRAKRQASPGPRRINNPCALTPPQCSKHPTQQQSVAGVGGGGGFASREEIEMQSGRGERTFV